MRRFLTRVNGDVRTMSDIPPILERRTSDDDPSENAFPASLAGFLGLAVGVVLGLVGSMLLDSTAAELRETKEAVESHAATIAERDATIDKMDATERHVLKELEKHQASLLEKSKVNAADTSLTSPPATSPRGLGISLSQIVKKWHHKNGWKPGHLWPRGTRPHELTYRAVYEKADVEYIVAGDPNDIEDFRVVCSIASVDDIGAMSIAIMLIADVGGWEVEELGQWLHGSRNELEQGEESNFVGRGKELTATIRGTGDAKRLSLWLHPPM